MEESNKRIAKNTIYLYIRQLVILVLSLFTTSIVLEKLGASDYGINNLVGGFVGGFAVLNGILSSGTRRFLSLYIGKGDAKELKSTFATALFIHVIIAIVVVIALEAFGVWFINHELNIAADRMYAANWVFQLSVIGVGIGIVQTPFEAAVTSHERFNIYAIMTIFNVVSKLLIVFMLIYLPGDKLITYSALGLGIGVISATVYNIYCQRQFPECRWSLKFDKPVMKEMLVFSGYGTFGHVIMVVNGQGISIILNLFFNTVMNAARGLAQTVNSTLGTFITGFIIAAEPQLVKYYGSEEMDKFKKLIFNVTQYSLFLLSIIIVPTVLEIDFVVNLWLRGNVPEYTCAFIKITQVCGIIYQSNCMVEMGLQAIGRVKENNLYSVPVYLLSLPIYYFILWSGVSPVYAYWGGAIPPFLSFLINLKLLSKYTGFEGRHFFVTIFLKTILLIGLSMIVPGIIQHLIEPGLIRFLIVCPLAVVSTIVVIWNLGMNDTTKQMVREQVVNKIFDKFRALRTT